ncbi:MAG: TIGR03790 family protein [Steroidobacteraceae bacterium]
MPCRLLLLGLALFVFGKVGAEDLSPERLGVLFNRNDAISSRVAQYYALHRHIPPMNLVGLPVPDRAVINRDELKQLRNLLLAQLPSNVQSLLLVWSRPYAVECMSITTAVAAGYQPGFCEPGCARTALNPLFDTPGWLPADTTGWLPAMLLPSDDEALAEAVIDRGIKADGSDPPGTVYLIRTQDMARNVRAAAYSETEALLSSRVMVRELASPINRAPADIVGYFTGAVRVEELPKLVFRPGAAADHLTSTGGVLDGFRQMSALEWLKQGATASYGTVSEPCAQLAKFPSPTVFFDHYLRGDTLLEAYWKSVAMPGQGLFIGEPLARPYPPHL